MTQKNTELPFFQIILMVLSIVSILIILIDFAILLDPEISKIIQTADVVICILFLYDFAYRLVKAKNKLHFMKWGWVDLLSSIPTIDFFRCGRLVRVIRLFKILRLLRVSKVLSKVILKHRRKNAALSALLISLLLLFTGSVGILIVEPTGVDVGMKTASDAVWWTFIALTTGSGDYCPITTEGRIIMAFLTMVGIGLFATFTGMIATWFLEEKKDNTK